MPLKDEKNKLPTIKDATAAPSPRTVNESGKPPQDLESILSEQRAISEARIADQKEDLQFLTQFYASEQKAQADAGQQRQGLADTAANDQMRLRAALEMNPILRDLRSIVGAVTGDDSSNVRILTQKARASQSALNVFDRGESKRQATSKRGLDIFKQLDKLQDEGLDVRQQVLDNELKIQSTFADLAKKEIDTDIAELQLGLKQRELTRTKRQDTLSRLPFSQILDLQEQAAASEAGFVNAGGVQLALGDLEAESNKRRSTMLDLESAELANQSARADIADQNYKRAVQGLTLEQLTQVAADNFQVQSESDAGPQSFALPPALVREEMERRVKLRQETAGITTELDINAASAIAELDILQRRTGDVTRRVESFFGANSGAARDIADELTRGSAGLRALVGDQPDEAALQEAIETGAIPKERAAAISRQAKKINAAVETRVDEMVKQAFPDDKVGQASLSAFIQGVDQSPHAAMTTLIKFALAGTPRGITVDSAMGQAISAVRESTMTFLQRNLQDPPNLQDLSGDELLQLVVDRNTSRVKPEHEGLIALAADAAYSRWSSTVTDSMLAQSVEASGSPAFGILNPSMVNAALANAQTIAAQKVPDETQVNDRAAIEAAEFMKQLKSIPANGQNAADVYVKHLNSDAFSQFVGATSEQLRTSSFPAYLLDNGAIQGNFMSDLNSLRDLYTRQSGAIQQEAMQKRAELTELFEDENQRNLFAIRVAGYLSAGADPDAVNQYVDELASTFDGDAQQIFDSINRNREAHQRREHIRKGILTKWGEAGVIFQSILKGMAQSSGSVQARGVTQRQKGIGTREQIEAAAETQRELGVFPSAPIPEVTN